MKTSERFSSTEIASFFEKIEKLPKIQRILISAGTFVLIIGAFVYFLYWPKFGEIDKLEKKLEKLEKQLNTAKRNAASLEKFQSKMKEAETQFKAAMRALPEKEEIPSLLTSISKSGQDVGLEFLLFEPKPEVRKEFYAEIPVAINVKGGYHDLAIFFDKVARLSRIVNVRNISMGRGNQGADLSTTCTAVTYKFVEPQPKAKAKAKKKKKK
ncbi:MAG: type 4a pilus biogenesis protein PilO [Desulfobacterales bacterium]|nr:MAG: type 4a pilus biogenesis protein PilO [Desulfobacterales bacterium]